MAYLGSGLAGHPDFDPAPADGQQSEIARLKAQIEKTSQALQSQRAHSSQALQKAESREAVLRNVLEQEKADEPSQDFFERFSWDNLGQTKEPKVSNSNRPPAPDQSQTFTADQVREITQQEISKAISQMANKVQTEQVTQQELQKKVISDYPHLANDPRAIETINELWAQSFRLNPNMDQQQRFEGVMPLVDNITKRWVQPKQSPAASPFPPMSQYGSPIERYHIEQQDKSNPFQSQPDENKLRSEMETIRMERVAAQNKFR